MAIPEKLVFDSLKPITVEVSIDGNSYILREASTESAKTYRNAKLSAARFGDKGKLQQVEGAADSQSLIVSLCLHKVVNGKMYTKRDGNPQPTPIAEVLAWPDRITDELFKTLLKISPTLRDEKSEKDLIEEISDLQKQLQELQEKNKINRNDPSSTIGDDEKNSQSATTENSV